MADLLKLAERCERAEGPEKALDREIALAIGWVRLTPSEARRKNPAWFHPDDCRDGKPVYDSLHGTDVWRDPLAYTASLDAAMTLLDGETFFHLSRFSPGEGPAEAHVYPNRHIGDDYNAFGATPALALTAASLRALSSLKGEGSTDA